MLRIIFLAVFVAVSGFVRADEPLKLHPDNPHYFSYKSKPTVLVTSGEHYGAVLNLDFDFVKYLETLAKDGLNNTRTFTGAYAEPVGAFNIAGNTLAPKSGRLITPWARSDEPGYANGGNKFDLSRWDPEYFERLKKFLTEADKRDIIVELDLFCPMYDDAMWNLSPMKAANNINGVGKVGKHEVYMLDKEPALLKIQEDMVRKIVQELNGFNNLYYEICNEPYFGGVATAWHDRIAELIHKTEKNLPKKHLVSWNVQNGSAKVENPHSAYSIFNFHYTSPPTAVAMNYGLNKPIGLNETGFKGTGDDYYRNEAWEFMLAGGAIYNNLDYSFTVDTPDGTVVPKAPTPGGGGVTFRKQTGILKRFIESFDFVKMKPDSKCLQTEGGYTLAEPGKQYAIFLRNSKDQTMRLNLPKGTYSGSWLNPLNGSSQEMTSLRQHSGGVVELRVPESFDKGVALKIVATKGDLQ